MVMFKISDKMFRFTLVYIDRNNEFHTRNLVVVTVVDPQPVFTSEDPDVKLKIYIMLRLKNKT